MFILFSGRACWKPVSWGTPARLQLWLRATSAPVASFLGKSPWFCSPTWSEAWKGHFSFWCWFQEAHHFPCFGRAFSEAMPQQSGFPGQWALETDQEWEPPCEKTKTSHLYLPLYNCVPPCLQSCGDVGVEGLEQENAFPRDSFKRDKTQSDNYVVSSLLLTHLPQPQQELKVKLPLKLGVSKLSQPEFPEGRTWAKVSVVPFYEEGANSGSLPDGERVWGRDAVRTNEPI